MYTFPTLSPITSDCTGSNVLGGGERETEKRDEGRKEGERREKEEGRGRKMKEKRRRGKREEEENDRILGAH